MPGKASGQPRIQRIERPQKNGDIYVYELSELPKYLTYDAKTDTVDTSKLNEATLKELLPWSPQAKAKCYNGRH